MQDYVGTFRGFGKERARLGTFRGFGTKFARLGTFGGFGKERIRLGTLRGFGTERARAGTFNQNFETFNQTELFFFSKGAKTISKHEDLHEKLKTVLPAVILIILFLSPNFTKFLNP